MKRCSILIATAFALSVSATVIPHEARSSNRELVPRQMASNNGGNGGNGGSSVGNTATGTGNGGPVGSGGSGGPVGSGGSGGFSWTALIPVFTEVAKEKEQEKIQEEQIQLAEIQAESGQRPASTTAPATGGVPAQPLNQPQQGANNGIPGQALNQPQQGVNNRVPSQPLSQTQPGITS